MTINRIAFQCSSRSCMVVSPCTLTINAAC